MDHDVHFAAERDGVAQGGDGELQPHAVGDGVADDPLGAAVFYRA
jgi:hypothetical protein